MCDKDDWMSIEILSLQDENRQLEEDNIEYQQKIRDYRTRCDEAAERLNELRSEFEEEIRIRNNTLAQKLCTYVDVGQYALSQLPGDTKLIRLLMEAGMRPR